MENNNNNFYQIKEMEISPREESNLGSITEQDKLLAAKQILIGLLIIYLVTILAYLLRPELGGNLLEIAKTVLPPLATLIIAFYFKDKTD